MISSGFPILGGPGSRCFRRPPLLPTDMRGRKRPETVDHRPVPNGIVHALHCGGRRAGCAAIHGPKKTLCNRFIRRAGRGIREGIFSAPADTEDPPDRLFIDSSRIRVHRCAGGGKGGPGPHAPMSIGRTKGGRNTGLHAVRDHKGRPVFLSIASCSRRPETCMIAGSHSAASRPCRHPPNLSPTKAMTAGNCANGLKRAGPGPSSRRERTAGSDITTIGPSTGSEISSDACSAASRTGGASQRASSATLKTSWQLSRSPQPSSRGYNEPGPWFPLASTWVVENRFGLSHVTNRARIFGQTATAAEYDAAIVQQTRTGIA